MMLRDEIVKFFRQELELYGNEMALQKDYAVAVTDVEKNSNSTFVSQKNNTE
jgi:hypothetical protein